MPYVGHVPEHKSKHDAAEVKHLREFYMYWMQMHAKASEQPIYVKGSQEMAQRLVMKAKELREFYV